MKKRICTLLTLALILLTVVTVLPVQSKSKIRLNTKKKTLTIGKTYKLKVKGTKKRVKWSSSNKYVATVTKKGKVRAKHKGTCWIKAKVAGKTLKCKLTVKKAFSPQPYQPLPQPTQPTSNNSVYIDESEITVNIGETKEIWVNTDNGQGISFNNNEYVSVSYGSWDQKRIPLKIKGEKEGLGVVNVYDTKNPNVKDSLNVNVSNPTPVNIPVTEIKLRCSKSDLVEGDNEKISATIYPSDATDQTLTWKSSDTNIATVDSSGNVKAVGNGHVTITAESSNGVKGQISFDIHIINISLPSLPKKINKYDYSNKLTSSCDVTEITFEKNYYSHDNEFTVIATFIGKKTFDTAPMTSSGCYIGYKLYNSNNVVVKSGSVLSTSVVPGEYFTGQAYFFDMVEGTYRLEILDVR